MSVPRRKGPIFGSSSPEDRLLMLKGVPSRYIRYNEESIGRPYNFTVERPWAKNGEAGKYAASDQQDVLASIFDDTAMQDTSAVVGVGSYPTDHLGMVFGAAVCRRALKLKLNPLMLGLWNMPSSTTLKEAPDVVVLYPLRPDTHPTRLEVCRDWLSILDDTFIVVIIGGSDPVTFFNNKLNCSLDSALYFRGESPGGKNYKR